MDIFEQIYRDAFNNELEKIAGCASHNRKEKKKKSKPLTKTSSDWKSIIRKAVNAQVNREKRRVGHL
jgi:hypothetical protein